MVCRRIISLALAIFVFLAILPIQAIAGAESEPIIEGDNLVSESTNTIGEIGGYLSGNTITTSKLFQERKFTYYRGSGFAAERANNLIDGMKGLQTYVVGDNNAKNGPDRLILRHNGDKILIQDKYYQTAARSVDAAFNGSKGSYRYIDGSGKPMMLEVPADQYDDAILLMRTKIENGQIPGVTNPDDAKLIVRKGNLTYKQAVNIAKAGTIESLTYDAMNGVISAGCAAGIGFAIDYACCVLNGLDPQAALKNASINGIKTGGVVFATYIISSQLAKTGMSNALIPTTRAISKTLGKDVCEAIALKAGVTATGQAATEHVAKILADNLIADGVLIIVLTGIDAVELFQGRISKEELLKNLTVTIISIAAGTAGFYGGAALGTLIAPGAGTAIGSVVGSVLAGGLSAWGAEKIIAPYYESDAEEMFNIISDEFIILCGDYLISKSEGDNITDALRGELTGNILKDMYAAEDRQMFARNLMEPLFVSVANEREAIELPSVEDMRYQMKSMLQGIVFIH